MDNKQRTIDFLEKVAKLCDEEATNMLNESKETGMDNELSALIYSTSIMNIFTHCKLIIDKTKK